MAHIPVGIRRERLVAPYHHDLRRHPLFVAVAVLVRLRRIDDGEVAERRYATAHARHIAGEPRETERRDVRRLERRLAEERHLPVDVASRTVHADDGVPAIGLPDVLHARLDLVVRLVPADALPLVLAALTRTPHGVLETIGIVHGLSQRQALDAQLAVRAGIERVALHALHLAVLGVEQDAARRMASGGRVVVGARNGIAVLLPLPLSRMVGFAVDRIEKLLIVSHPHSSSLVVFPVIARNSQSCGRDEGLARA